MQTSPDFCARLLKLTESLHTLNREIPPHQAFGVDEGRRNNALANMRGAANLLFEAAQWLDSTIYLAPPR